MQMHVQLMFHFIVFYLSILFRCICSSFVVNSSRAGFYEDFLQKYLIQVWIGLMIPCTYLNVPLWLFLHVIIEMEKLNLCVFNKIYLSQKGNICFYMCKLILSRYKNPNLTSNFNALILLSILIFQYFCSLFSFSGFFPMSIFPRFYWVHRYFLSCFCHQISRWNINRLSCGISTAFVMAMTD